MSTPADILRSMPLVCDYARSFTAATGLCLALEAPGEIHLAPTGLPECCRRMLAQGKTRELCKQTHRSLHGGTPRTVLCFAGLTSSAIPVVARGKTVAYLHTGHTALNGNTDARQLDAPRKTLAQYEGAVHLLEIFARQLSESLPHTTSGTPYPAIDRAARAIRERPEDRWRLTTLARNAKMNPAYFSEMFRRRLGITLTRFIASVRIEKSVQLLRNTDLKIIEIAYASGFGSVSQFNRVFAATTGTTPRLYRART